MKGKYYVSVLIVVAITVFLSLSAMPVMAKPSYVTVTLRDGTGHVLPNYYVGVYPLSGVRSYSAMVQTDSHGKAMVGVPSDWTSYSSVRVYVNPFSNDFSCYYYEPFALNKQYSGNIRITTCQAAGDSLCLDGCYDLQTDLNNCGSCGYACSFAHASSSCDSGSCTLGSCNTGFGNCDSLNGNGCEANLNTNTQNCGTCGNACSPYNAIAECDGGACSFSSCDTGYGNCDGNDQNGCEADIITSIYDCGTCGNECSFTNAGSSCSAGSCTIGECVTGYANCDNNAGNGCEQNVLTDTQNCGTCGNICPAVTNGVPSCFGGTCSIGSCTTGYADCDTSPGNGCEVNLDTSVPNCGSCGNVCTVANGDPSCFGGSCSIGSCAAGYGDCNTDYGDGCEVNLNTDFENCSSCGNVCLFANAAAECTSGSCTMGSCVPPYGDCNTLDSDGCEANLNTETDNCGTCGTACTVANGAPSCSGGSCYVDSCDPGYDDCDGDYANGCETDITTINNCGSCGNLCDNTDGTPSCNAAGFCEITCDPNYGDCDVYSPNGCETYLLTDTQNCGSCDNACPATNGMAECNSGSCGITCDSGWGDCNGPSSVGSGPLLSPTLDGCETNLNTDALNCNYCGNACSTFHGSASCSSGACGITCDSGYGDCNNDVSDGCEADLSNNLLHCGSCGNVCSTNNGSASCTSGTCEITCDSGYGDCNDNAADGCESDFSKDDQHCGSCGNSCVGLSCVGGSCQT